MKMTWIQFRADNYWFNNKDLCKFMEYVWNLVEVEGKQAYKFRKKSLKF